LWELGLGVQVRKDQTSNDITVGAYLIPYGIGVDAFALGVGISCLAVGSLSNGLDHWSIIIPLTYQVRGDQEMVGSLECYRRRR
jgi:hypothetical protein